METVFPKTGTDDVSDRQADWLGIAVGESAPAVSACYTGRKAHVSQANALQKAQNYSMGDTENLPDINVVCTIFFPQSWHSC